MDELITGITWEHRVITVPRQRLHKVDWQSVEYIHVYQSKCSCGWRTGWLVDPVRARQRAGEHAIDGQLSFPMVD